MATKLSFTHERQLIPLPGALAWYPEAPYPHTGLSQSLLSVTGADAGQQELFTFFSFFWLSTRIQPHCNRIGVTGWHTLKSSASRSMTRERGLGCLALLGFPFARCVCGASLVRALRTWCARSQGKICVYCCSLAPDIDARAVVAAPCTTEGVRCTPQKSALRNCPDRAFIWQNQVVVPTCATNFRTTAASSRKSTFATSSSPAARCSRWCSLKCASPSKYGKATYRTSISCACGLSTSTNTSGCFATSCTTTTFGATSRPTNLKRTPHGGFSSTYVQARCPTTPACITTADVASVLAF